MFDGGGRVIEVKLALVSSCTIPKKNRSRGILLKMFYILLLKVKQSGQGVKLYFLVIIKIFSFQARINQELVSKKIVF